MTLEDLVPPLKLCKQIPEGKFSDSALIWCYDGDFWSIQDRNAVMPYIPEDTHPAPTLQEILNNLPTSIGDKIKLIPVLLDRRSFKGDFQIGYARNCSYGGLTSHQKYREHDLNPATAALRLWLSVQSVQSEKSDKSETKKEQQMENNLKEIPITKNGHVLTPNEVKDEIQRINGEGIMQTASDIISAKCDELKNLLLEKNRKYGNSALSPIRIFSRATTIEQILVRIDDKLNRIKNRQSDEDEDVIMDLAGYLILLMIAKGGEK